MQATGLIEREETNGLRLVRKGNEDEGLTDAITTPMASRIDPTLPQGKFPSVASSVDRAGGS